MPTTLQPISFTQRLLACQTTKLTTIEGETHIVACDDIEKRNFVLINAIKNIFDNNIQPFIDFTVQQYKKWHKNSECELSIENSNNTLRDFYSSVPVETTLWDFFHRFTADIKCPTEKCECALMLLAVLTQTLSNNHIGKFLYGISIHRYMVAICTISRKMGDNFIRNDFIAQHVGMPTEEFDLLEEIVFRDVLLDGGVTLFFPEAIDNLARLNNYIEAIFNRAAKRHGLILERLKYKEKDETSKVQKVRPRGLFECSVKPRSPVRETALWNQVPTSRA